MARPAESYRGYRRNFAKANKLVWRVLERVSVGGKKRRRGAQEVVVIRQPF